MSDSRQGNEDKASSSGDNQRDEDPREVARILERLEAGMMQHLADFNVRFDRIEAQLNGMLRFVDVLDQNVRADQKSAPPKEDGAE